MTTSSVMWKSRTSTRPEEKKKIAELKHLSNSPHTIPFWFHKCLSVLGFIPQTQRTFEAASSLFAMNAECAQVQHNRLVQGFLELFKTGLVMLKYRWTGGRLSDLGK